MQLPAAWATVKFAETYKLENPRSESSGDFVLRGARGAPVYLKFSAAFYKRRWGRGAKPLGAARRPRNSPSHKAQEGGLGETLAGGFPPNCVWMQMPAAWSTVKFAKTYNRKLKELLLLGFCSTRPALRAAHLPPDAVWQPDGRSPCLPCTAGEAYNRKAAGLAPRLLHCVIYTSMCQIFSAYSLTARSAAKMPLSAMFTRLMRANSLLLAAVAYRRSWQAT